MTDWIHCNKCFTRYRSDIKFYVTTCGHIKCQTCVAKLGNEKRCLVCNSPFDMVVLNNLNSDLQCFFQSPTDFIDKAKQVCAFQQTNTISLLKNITAKYSSAKTEILKNHKMIQDLKKENTRLRMLINTAIKGNFTTSTPLMGGPLGTPSSASTTGSFFSPVGFPGRSSNQGNAYMQKQPQRFMHSNQLGNLSRVKMQQQQPDGLNSFTHSGSSRAGSSQGPSPAQASIPRFGTSSFQHAAMRSMSNLGLGNKPR